MKPVSMKYGGGSVEGWVPRYGVESGCRTGHATVKS